MPQIECGCNYVYIRVVRPSPTIKARGEINLDIKNQPSIIGLKKTDY